MPSGENIQIRPLSGISSRELHQAFLLSFSDYLVDVSYLTEENLYKRAIKNGVDWEVSPGIFDNGKLVGYTMNSIGLFDGIMSSFDIATGMGKEYRGQGLAGKLFDFALPLLKKKGVKQCVLEVLQENEAAINAYMKSGFYISRDFDYYEWEFEFGQEKDALTEIRIEKSDRQVIRKFKNEMDWLPSWENSLDSILRIPDEVMVWLAYIPEGPAGLIVYYPALHWLMNLVVKKKFRRQGIARAMLKELQFALQGRIPFMKLINADHKDEGMRIFLENAGFKLKGKQWEMRREI